jgi:hypothetical protein
MALDRTFSLQRTQNTVEDEFVFRPRQKLYFLAKLPRQSKVPRDPKQCVASVAIYLSFSIMLTGVES